MDDQTPSTPPHDAPQTTPEAGEAKPIVPDPHRGEPVPPPQEGMRPEAVASGIRPEQDEPGGPLVGLVAASGAEVEAELTGDAGAEELLAMMGVEEEGIEAGQISGIVVAMLVSIAALAVAMYFLFYSPTLDKTFGVAESEVRYDELDTVTADGRSRLTQYTRADSAYTLPIESAMAAVAAEYSGGSAPDGPRTRASFNTTMLPSAGAVQRMTATADTVQTMIGDVVVPTADGSQEEVGSDSPEDPDSAGSGL